MEEIKMLEKSKFLGIFMLSLLLIFGGCSSVVYQEEEKKLDSSEEDYKDENRLKKFNSIDEMKDFIKENDIYLDYYHKNTRRTLGNDIQFSTVSEAAFSESSIDSGGVAEEFSTTNNQVEGVEEPDIVKNDGRYIYTITQNKVIIVDAFPPGISQISEILEFDGSPQDIFIEGDKLMVMVNRYDDITKVSQYDFVPEKSSVPKTHVYIYDTTNKNNPSLEMEYSVEGFYKDARMIDGKAYVIVEQSVFNSLDDIIQPVLRDSSNSFIVPDVFYFDVPYNSYNFNTIASFDINTNEVKSVKTFLLGHSTTLYVSKGNIYIAYEKPLKVDQKEEVLERFYTAVIPQLPKSLQDELLPLKDAKDSIEYEILPKIISDRLSIFYNTLTSEGKEELIINIQDALYEYDQKREEDLRKTIIQKFVIHSGNIDYITHKEVNGYLLNQFSMDEHNGDLRVATTTYKYFREGLETYNNVYIFDEFLIDKGKIENIAEDERIYSTRFIGDTLYMVTFKQIDPFFVIDLSNPTNPKILGELKIPGFSQYLHPYDDLHIIGLGKDTKESEFGGIVTNGVKVSLFDVSDFENPREVDNYVVEGRWVDSAALYEHKAFLFDKNKNLLVIPIRKPSEFEDKDSYYSGNFFEGAYVFNIDSETGIDLKGQITHSSTENQNYWRSPSSIQRSLYMNNFLYTISQKNIFINDLDDLSLSNQLELPYTDPRYLQ